MTLQAARLLLRLGIGMIMLALVVRLAGMSEANRVGDDLAIAASALLVVVAGVYVVTHRVDAD